MEVQDLGRMKEETNIPTTMPLFSEDNANWMLVGTDGGLYGTFDNGGRTGGIYWHMPITRFL